MRWTDLLWFFPLGLVVSLVVGAVGRRDPREVAVASLHTFWTLVCILGGVMLTIRLLVVFFVG